MKKIDDIETYLGVPFSKKGRSRKEGFDCWGLIMDLTKRVHDLDLPDPEYTPKTREDVAKMYASYDILEWVDQIAVEDMQYGDLVAMWSLTMRMPYHFGMCIGEGKVIHIMGSIVEVQVIERLMPYLAGVYRLKLPS